jgi:uncharacterized protein involved in exopolysaccharide biosynthesis
LNANNSLPALPRAGLGSPPEILPPAPQYLPPGTSLAQLLTIARAYWLHTAAIALVVVVVVAVALRILPKTYTATASLMVNYEVNQGGKEFPIAVLGSYMATQVEFMESDRVLLPVIESLHLTEDRELTTGFGGADAAARTLWVLKNLRMSLNISQGRGSQLLYVEVGAREPNKAARIANAIADVYLLEERRLVNEPASQRAREYSAQLAELQAKVTAAQEKVTTFRRQSGLSDIAAHNDLEWQSLNTLEQQLLAVQNVRRANEAKALGDRAVSDEVLTSETVQTLKGELMAQESQLAQLGATLGSRHPRVLEIRSRIAATRAALRREIDLYTSSNSTQVSSGRQLEETLGRAVREERNRLVAVRQQQDQGAKLLLELESAQAVYKRALDGYDQIMFASGGKLTNVSLMSRAAPAVAAAKPRKLKWMLAGVVAACIAGISVPLIYEMGFNRRIRCRDDLERDFGMPVLAELDSVAHEGPGA